MSLDTLFAMLNSTSGLDNSFSAAQDWDTEQSRVYNVKGARMSVQPGTIIPIVYGRSLVSPTMINYYVEEGESDTLNMLLGVSEGEIRSISNIKVNGAPIENFYGENANDPWGNNAEIITRKGTINQEAIPGFDDISNVLEKNIELTQNNSVIHTTTISNCQVFKLAFQIDKLYQIDDNGTARSWYFNIKIEYRQVGETDWRFAGNHQFTSQTESLFKRYFKSEYLYPAQYEIRITKTTEDANDMRFGTVTLLTINEIVATSLKYPSTSLLGIRLITPNKINNITCEVDGLLIRVPAVKYSDGSLVDWEDYYWDSTLNIYRLLSTGLHLDWDGSYTTMWSGNPVWCIRDLLLSRRYGWGNKITEDMIDEESFLAAAQYCEEGVLGLNGQLEKRARLDIVLDVERPADEWVNTICHTFRGIMDYSTNDIRIVIEKAEDAVYLFNQTNIFPKSFSIDYISKESIPNVLHLSYSNKDKNYQMDSYTMASSQAILAGDDLDEQSVPYTGITRISQLLREGTILLKKLQTNIKPISFKTTISAFTCQKGDIFFFQSDLNGWGEGGRLHANSTATLIKLDKDVTLELGKNYEIAIKHGQTDVLQVRVISTSGVTTDEITVSTGFSFVPEQYDEWYIYEEDTEIKYRIADITRNFDGTIDIRGINYNANVYDWSGITTPKDNFKYLTLEIPLVTNLVVEEKDVRLNDGTIDISISVSFFKPVKSTKYVKVAKSFEIYLSDNDGISWNFVGSTDKNFYNIKQAFSLNARYTVAVVTVTDTGDSNVPSNSPQASVTILGWKTPPSDITNFTYTFEEEILFEWDKIVEANLGGYEIRTENDNWGINNSYFIWRGKADNYTKVRPEKRDGIVYYIKAYNTSGIYSVNSAYITPKNLPPEAPSLLHTPLFQKTFLMWNDSTDTDLVGYEVWQNSEDVWTGEEVGNEELIHKSNGTSAIMTIPYERTYYRVRGIDKFGAGEFSNVVYADQTLLDGSTIEANSIKEVHISDNAITAPKILAGQITAAHISALSITAEKMNIAELSAITANMGTITAGTMVGACIKTSVDDYAIHIDRDGIRGYNANGVKTVELTQGDLFLYDPLCTDFYSHLDAGALVFNHPYGTVPYLKRLQTGCATAGTTVTLCQWYEEPSVQLGINRLSSYDPTSCESCQEFRVYADNIRSYDNGSGDFGWKFDVHSRLVVSGGTRDECVWLVAFDISECTGANTCAVLVKELFQMWCHDAAPETYRYGVSNYQVRYRCLGCGVWCACDYTYIQPHGTISQMRNTNVSCQTLQFSCGATWELQLHETSSCYLDSGIVSGGTLCVLCCYYYQVDCSYCTTCLIEGQSQSWNLESRIVSPGPAYSGSDCVCERKCIEFGSWDTNLHPIINTYMYIRTDSVYLEGFAANGGDCSLADGHAYACISTLTCSKGISVYAYSKDCLCYCSVPPASRQYYSSGWQTGFSGYAYTCVTYSACGDVGSCHYARVCGTMYGCLLVCYKECLICNCLCCFWYPQPCGGAESCDYKRFYSSQDTTDTEVKLDASGTVNYLAIAYS